MQSFLAKCAALGIVAGGFTLTGDVGRLADRGRRLLDARTVPSEMAVEPTSEAASALPSVPTASPVAMPEAAPSPAVPQAATAPAPAPTPDTPAASASEPTRSMPPEARADAPVGRAVSVPAPPASGPDSIDLRQVTAGSRLLIWIRRPGASARSVDLIALDIIDPISGEALEHRHAALTVGAPAPVGTAGPVATHGTEATTVHAAPRRVVITRNAASCIAKGSTLRIAPLHGVNGLGSEEHVGTILAFSIPAR